MSESGVEATRLLGGGDSDAAGTQTKSETSRRPVTVTVMVVYFTHYDTGATN